MKTLKQNTTHKAVQENEVIKIYIKGFHIDELVFNDEYLFSIKTENKDDLFAIFERLDEDNRINLAGINNNY